MATTPAQSSARRIGAVVIGRNEGERLVRCLASMAGQADHIVYVDSGSTDDSVAAARSAGVEVVELDMSVPFTAARARNAGFEALAAGTEFDYVQFVDGDCAIVDDWIPAAADALDADEGLGIVTGWRSEIHRDRSVYNQLCDFEWHRPAGPIQTCGGDMMVRRIAFEQAGGFDPTVIAAEDDEFCVRVRKAGWRMERLPLDMTRHDAAMTEFRQWWKRAVRSGHGFAQVGHMHPEYFVKERRRVWLFGAVLPLIALISLFILPILVLGVLALYAVSYVRTSAGLEREGLPKAEARSHAGLITLSKFPNFLGVVTFHWRQLRGASMRIIEYK